MPREVHHITIEKTSTSELLRIAREVQRSGIPTIIHADGEEIAQIAPTATRKRRSRTKVLKFEEGCNDWLLNMVGMFEDGGDPDVARNVDKYLAQAYYEEFHPPKNT